MSHRRRRLSDDLIRNRSIRRCMIRFIDQDVLHSIRQLAWMGERCFLDDSVRMLAYIDGFARYQRLRAFRGFVYRKLAGRCNRAGVFFFANALSDTKEPFIKPSARRREERCSLAAAFGAWRGIAPTGDKVGQLKTGQGGNHEGWINRSFATESSLSWHLRQSGCFALVKSAAVVGYHSRCLTEMNHGNKPHL